MLDISYLLYLGLTTTREMREILKGGWMEVVGDRVVWFV